jgi:hypothetical protein
VTDNFSYAELEEVEEPLPEEIASNKQEEMEPEIDVCSNDSVELPED